MRTQGKGKKRPNITNRRDSLGRVIRETDKTVKKAGSGVKNSPGLSFSSQPQPVIPRKKRKDINSKLNDVQSIMAAKNNLMSSEMFDLDDLYSSMMIEALLDDNDSYLDDSIEMYRKSILETEDKWLDRAGIKETFRRLKNNEPLTAGVNRRVSPNKALDQLYVLREASRTIGIHEDDFYLNSKPFFYGLLDNNYTNMAEGKISLRNWITDTMQKRSGELSEENMGKAQELIDMTKKNI